MKISRSYILGLGSGLILSALITMIVPIYQQQQNGSAGSPAVTAQTSKNQAPSQGQNTSSSTGQSSENQVNDPGQKSSDKQKDVSSPKNNNQENPYSDKQEGSQTPINNEEINSSTDSSSDMIPAEGSTTNQTEEIFVISSGMTAQRIADELETQGFIPDKTKFLELVKEQKAAAKFRAGNYNLTKGMPETELLNELIKG